MRFKFEINQSVTIAISGEEGVIEGRAEYAIGENSYFLTYKTADGRAAREWWPESALNSR
jgi:hypothetical protein